VNYIEKIKRMNNNLGKVNRERLRLVRKHFDIFKEVTSNVNNISVEIQPVNKHIVTIYFNDMDEEEHIVIDSSRYSGKLYLSDLENIKEVVDVLYLNMNIIKKRLYQNMKDVYDYDGIEDKYDIDYIQEIRKINNSLDNTNKEKAVKDKLEQLADITDNVDGLMIKIHDVLIKFHPKHYNGAGSDIIIDSAIQTGFDMLDIGLYNRELEIIYSSLDVLEQRVYNAIKKRYNERRVDKSERNNN